jgi:hypothetical protein
MAGRATREPGIRRNVLTVGVRTYRDETGD